jgi:hypothetical protein
VGFGVVAVSAPDVRVSSSAAELSILRRVKFLDAAITVPDSWAQALRMLLVPLVLALCVALGARLIGLAPLGALLVGVGAFLGAGLAAVGISVTRAPLAYCTALLATALALFTALMLATG